VKRAPDRKKVQHTSLSAEKMKNLTDDDINAFYSRQGARTHQQF